MSGIYKIYWEQTGEFYIGRSRNIQRRFIEHMVWIKKRDSYAKFGLPKLEILEETSWNLLNLERKYINENLHKDGCLNSQWTYKRPKRDYRDYIPPKEIKVDTNIPIPSKSVGNL